MDNNELRVPKEPKPPKKHHEIRKKPDNPKPKNPNYQPPKEFKTCNLKEFFLTSNILNDKDLDDLEDSVKYWKLDKCIKNLNYYLNHEDKLEKTILVAHEVIKKFIDDKMKPVLLQGYLEILASHAENVKKLCNFKEIKAIENQIHDYDYPYFCHAFGIEITDKTVDKLLKIYAQDGVFSSGFKLIEVSGSHKNTARIDILVKGAMDNELKEVVPYLLKLGYTHKDFPHLQSKLLNDSAFYFLHSQGYEYAQEIFRSYPALLAKLMDHLMTIKKGKKLDEALSVCSRNPEIIKHMRNPQKVKKQLSELKKVIPNPLQIDVFGPSNPEEFWSFSDFGLTSKDVLFLNENHPAIEKTLQKLFATDIIGIDTESLVARTKFDTDIGLVATLQIANSTEAYLLDPIKANKPNIVKYLKEFVQNPNKIIVGHTVDDDLKLILNSFGIKQWKCKVIELKQMFEILHPEEKKNLANMCGKILGKPICKKYTLTDWGRRPLLKNQIHYAAMDAYIVIMLYNKMQALLQDKKKQA